MSPFFQTEDDTYSEKEIALLHMLEREYTPHLLRTILLPLITQTSPVSLRVLDWAVVNWSKKHSIVCSCVNPGEMVNMYHAYRAALTFWRRRLFDPFRRRRRIVVLIDGKEYETTLGQANFALFIYKNGILSYILTHASEIEQDMTAVSRKQRRTRSRERRDGARKKRHELTPSACAPCIAYRAPLRMEFK